MNTDFVDLLNVSLDPCAETTPDRKTNENKALSYQAILSSRRASRNRTRVPAAELHLVFTRPMRRRSSMVNACWYNDTFISWLLYSAAHDGGDHFSSTPPLSRDRGGMPG
jgi:hypothetical protein